MNVLNSFNILKTLRDVLRDTDAIVSLLGRNAQAIPINEYANEDENATPWAGIYLRRSTIEPGTIPKGWKTLLEVSIVTQVAETREDTATGLLDDLNREIINTVANNLDLRRTVDMVRDINVEYTYLETDRETLYFQMAIINLTLEVRGNVRR